MKLTRYLYKGPQSAATLRLAGEPTTLLEVQLTPNAPVELPADHEYVQVLVALKHLDLLPDATSLAATVEAPALPGALDSTAAVIETGKKGGKA